MLVSRVSRKQMKKTERVIKKKFQVRLAKLLLEDELTWNCEDVNHDYG